MALGLYLSQDLAFGGIVIGKTHVWQLVIAGLCSIISAFAGGFISGQLAPMKDRAPQVILAFGIMVESTAPYMEGSFLNPLWFNMISTLLLIISIFWGGHYYLSRRKRRLFRDIE